MKAVVTGGTSGIGMAITRLIIANGGSVAFIGRNTKRGERLQADLGDRAKFIQADLTDLAAIKRAADEAAAFLGDIDSLVNAAGVYQEKALSELTNADYTEVMDLNLKAAIFLTQAVLPYLTSGAIVNLASDAGIRGNYLTTLYSASKGGLIAFTKSLALELAPKIRVNAVAPADILTPMTERQLLDYPSRADGLRIMSEIYPLKRLGTAEEVAELCYFLLSDKAGFTTGAVYTIDGGLGA